LVERLWLFEEGRGDHFEEDQEVKQFDILCDLHFVVDILPGGQGYSQNGAFLKKEHLIIVVD